MQMQLVFSVYKLLIWRIFVLLSGWHVAFHCAPSYASGRASAIEGRVVSLLWQMTPSQKEMPA